MPIILVRIHVHNCVYIYLNLADRSVLSQLCT